MLREEDDSAKQYRLSQKRMRQQHVASRERIVATIVFATAGIFATASALTLG